MRNYVSLLQELLISPHYHLFGKVLRFNLTRQDFPILTLKNIDFGALDTKSIPYDIVTKNGTLVSYIPTIDAFNYLPEEISRIALHAYEKQAVELVIMIGHCFLVEQDLLAATRMLTRWPKLPPKIKRRLDTNEFYLDGYNPHAMRP